MSGTPSLVVGEPIDSLCTPALLVDRDVLVSNIERMAERGRRLGVRLRPHVKTHKSIDIARVQREHGAQGFTVSTLAEARALIEHGLTDLTWAYPIIPSRIDELRALTQRASINLLVDSFEAYRALETARIEAAVFLKIDCGYHRVGVPPESPLVVELASAIRGSATLSFAGILTHAGQSYACRSPESLREVARSERETMISVKRALERAGLAVPTVSIGSTPTMSIADDLTGIDEIRPGNYVFYDYTQTQIGSATLSECAATVLTQVVSSSEERHTSVIDAGALALSHDPGPDPARPSRGHVITRTPLSDHPRCDRAASDHPTPDQPTADWPASNPPATTLRIEARIVGVSQEHGIVNRAYPVGQRLTVLPNHSCLTAACFDAYHVVEGDRVVDVYPIARSRS